MPAKLKPVLEQTFDLPQTDALLADPTDPNFEPTKVTIAQAAQGQHDKRMDLWAEFKKSISEQGEIEVTQKVSPADVRSLEVYLTMKGCNLQDEDGSQLFKFPLEWELYKKAWAKLPPVVAEEIHSKVLAVNVLWSGESGEDD